MDIDLNHEVSCSRQNCSEKLIRRADMEMNPLLDRSGKRSDAIVYCYLLKLNLKLRFSEYFNDSRRYLLKTNILVLVHDAIIL